MKVIVVSNPIRCLILSFVAMVSGCSGVSECDPEMWGNVPFDAIGWNNQADRTSYFKSIRSDFLGLKMNEAAQKLGTPIRIKYKSRAWIYELGKIRFMSCEVATTALMYLEYDRNERLIGVTAYLD